MDTGSTKSRQETNRDTKKIMKLNLGSGFVKIPGFINVDIDKNVEPDMVADIRDLKEIENESVDEILASHVLEHFLQKETFGILREWYRVLKKEGIIYVIVPDINKIISDYTQGKANLCCLEKVILGSDQSATEFMIHKNIFTRKKLKRFLIVTGYRDIIDLPPQREYELGLGAIK